MRATIVLVLSTMTLIIALARGRLCSSSWGIVADKLGTGRTDGAVHQKYNKITRGDNPITVRFAIVSNIVVSRTL